MASRSLQDVPLPAKRYNPSVSILSDLRRYILRHNLLVESARVVVGVSGGPDSLALLHALRALAPEFGWHLHAAYLHHGLRAEADAEARFVAEVASAWGVGCTIERGDVRAAAAQPGVSLEEAARHVRYAFLAGVARKLNAGYVAVGHHADDQAETLLMHLLRGSGLAGLRGMLPSTPLASLRLTSLSPNLRSDPGAIFLVRPWLETLRSDILAYCEANGLQPHFDASNTDSTFFRNRLRHEALPLLRQINPNLTTILNHTAAVLQADFEILDARRRSLWERLAQERPGGVVFDLAEFRDLARGDQRALLRRAIVTLQPEQRNINWAHSEGLLDVLASDVTASSGGPYPLVAGLTAWLNYTRLEIVAGLDLTDFPQVGETVPLFLPGQAMLDGGWQLTSQWIEWSPGSAPPWAGSRDASRIWLPADVSGPLWVRPRQPGDRMRTLASGGSKSIPDLMTELKLPRPARSRWPLLVDADGRVLWVVGRRVAEGCRLSGEVRGAWEVRLVAAAITLAR